MNVSIYTCILEKEGGGGGGGGNSRHVASGEYRHLFCLSIYNDEAFGVDTKYDSILVWKGITESTPSQISETRR